MNKDDDFTNNVRSAWMWSKLSELGMTSVMVEFSGGGDSGQVDDITVDENSDCWELESTVIDNPDRFTLKQAIEAVSERIFALNSLPDWYNNDGGGGDFTFDVEARVVRVNVYQNVTTREYQTFELEGL